MTKASTSQRDGLGNACFYLHLVILVFLLLGWLIPAPAGLIVYLAFVPAMVLHWIVNRGACALNNLENWLRYRRWRAPERNPEEGAWLRTLIQSRTGIAFSRRAMDRIIYGALTLFWALAWIHLLEFQGS